MSGHYLGNGDDATAKGLMMYGCHQPSRYEMPKHRCAECGYLVKHPEPAVLRELMQIHCAEEHGWVHPAEVTA